jgi:glycerate kinase
VSTRLQKEVLQVKIQKVLLVPDSFKGTMSSGEICDIMEKSIHRFYPEAQVVRIPVADGGEGSVESFLAAAGGKKIELTVKGPLFEEIRSFYGRLPDDTAVVEMAAAAGFPLMGNRRCVEKATTYGVGQLIEHAASSGCRKIIVGLGGSATNDGGVGMAAALGVRFRNEEGKPFLPTGATLGEIASIDISGLSSALKGTEIIAMCDVDNPLCGPSGAAAVFGPQKGANAQIVQVLDKNLGHLAGLIKRDLKKDIIQMRGAGAAGGMGGGMVAFWGSRLQMGIETVLDTVHFDSLLKGADLVLSGEGKIDSQSLRGKTVIGVARRAKQQGVPVVAIVGDVGDQIDEIYEEGVYTIFSINTVAVPFSKAKLRCRSDFAFTMDNLMRFTLLFFGSGFK